MRAEHIKTIELADATISVFADDEFIGRAFAHDGAYSRDECALLARLLKPGDRVVEVGANIGAITIALARAVGPMGEVWAFEPQAENFGLLGRNVSDNGLDDVVRLFDFALGDAHGKSTVPHFSELEHRNYGNITLAAGTQPCAVETLDSVARDTRVALIKIDAEGSEQSVIRGARKTIELWRPVMYVENDREPAAILQLIRSLGYRCFYHHPRIASEQCNALDNHGRLLRDISSLMLLCIPEERRAEFAELTGEMRPAVPESPRLGRSGWAGVARLGGIGDNLIAASVLRPLKSAGFKIDVITSLPQGVVFENNPFIDKLSIKAQNDLPSQPADWQAWFRSRAAEYDIFAHLTHTCEMSLAMLPQQTQAQWRASARRKYCGHNYLEFVHDVAGMPYEFGPLYFPTDEEREQASGTRKVIGAGPIIGWALNGSRLDKVYPKAPIAVARLIKELGAQVVMFGGPAPYPDFERAKQIQEHVQHQNGNDRGLHLALSPDPNNPTWPIRRVLAQLFDCDLVIGPDTGQMWAVAFEPMPKIMLHSHASVENICKHWRNTTSLHADPATVPCWPCHMLHDSVISCLDEQRRHGMKPHVEEKGAACIQTISVETIIRTAKERLAT